MNDTVRTLLVEYLSGLETRLSHLKLGRGELVVALMEKEEQLQKLEETIAAICETLDQKVRV